MTIALSVLEAMKGDECIVLLYGEAGLTRQIFRADEEISARLVPRRGPRAVEKRFVEALALLRGHTAITEDFGARESVIAVVGFVDDECDRGGERPQIEVPRVIAGARLFDVEKPARKCPKCRFGLEVFHQRV